MNTVSRRERALVLWDQLSAAGELTSPAADRAARRKLLGFPPRINKKDLAERLLYGGTVQQHEREFLAGWLKGKKQNPKHRPPAAETAIKADEVAQFVFYFKAVHPKAQRKAIDAAVKTLYGVSPRYVTDALKLDPERKKHMMTSAAIFVAMLDEA